jgi:organic radical activating enzyme
MDYFCSLPFRSMMTFNTGGIKPCCDSESMQDSKHQSLMDTWNSEKWKNLRQSFLQGQKDAACDVCWKKESKGLVSARDNDPSKVNLQDCGPDGSMRVSPKFLSLRLGNKCNLACIMCTPQNSTFWERDIDIYKEYMNRETKPEEVFLKERKEDFLNLISSAEVITFIGGEPLLFREHEEIISNLIQAKRAPFVELHYYTNMTVLPDRVLEFWSQFKKIDLRSSIDAVGQDYEYIRFPANWKVIEKNMLKLNQAGLNHLTHSICFVLMNINSLQLEKLFQWREQIVWDKSPPIIRPDYLIDPDFLRPHVLQTREKSLAVSSLERTLRYCNEEEKRLVGDMLLQIIENVDETDELLKKLQKYLGVLDKSRGLNANELWPWVFDVQKKGVQSGLANCPK